MSPFYLLCIVCLIACTAAVSARHPSTQQRTMDVSRQGQVSPSEETLWVQANGLRLKTQIYQSARSSSRRVLIVVLHGDLLGVRAIPTATYHAVFARDAAKEIDDVVVASLLRPGYRDHTGEYSDGERGLTTGDNYTPEVVDAVAEVIDQLKARFRPAQTVLAGHSGGAAITGNLLGRWPSRVDAGFMVSCPCDLAAWRKHMQETQGNNPIWSAPVRSLSPIDLIGKVLPSVRVRLLVGARDTVTPAALSKRYADALRANGGDVTLEIDDGLDHDMLLEPVTLKALANLVAVVKRR